MSMNSSDRPEIMDHFAFIGTYPFGAPDRFTAEDLLSEMDAARMSVAWVTDIGSLYVKEASARNAALLRQCAAHHDRLLPVPLLDLRSPAWPREVRRLCDSGPIRAVRIAPNHHVYALTPAVVDALTHVLAERGLALLLAREIEDVRFQPACLRIGPVTVEQVRTLWNAGPTVPLILNNFTPGEVAGLEAIPDHVWFDCAAFDRGFGGLEDAVTRHGAERFCFGSHAPFLYPRAALTNLAESGLDDASVRTILHGPSLS